MFEKYTERARRVIFFGRYEASQFGSPYIETEHLLLGLLREDGNLRYKLSLDGVDKVRNEVKQRCPVRGEKISVSVDLPLSDDSKRVLSYASEESCDTGQRVIDAGHLALGLLRMRGSVAVDIL